MTLGSDGVLGSAAQGSSSFVATASPPRVLRARSAPASRSTATVDADTPEFEVRPLTAEQVGAGTDHMPASRAIESMRWP